MDPRVARTQQRLQDALFELAHERGINQVSVSDVAERAGVNRSTFYQHYADLDTVLADALDRFAATAGAQLEQFVVPCDEPPAALVSFLTYVHHHAVVYRQVFSEPGNGLVLARLRGHIAAAITHVATRDGALGTDMPLDVMTAGITGSIVGVMGAWLDTSPLPPPQTAALWVWQIVMGPPDSQGRRPCAPGEGPEAA